MTNLAPTYWLLRGHNLPGANTKISISFLWLIRSLSSFAEAHEHRGPGAREVRSRDAFGAFKIIDIAKFADSIYVLHCFQKKTEITSKADLDLAAKRYRDLLKELG